MNKRLSEQSRLLALAAVLMIGSSVLISYLALNLFERQLNPAMERKAQVVGESLGTLLGRLATYGLPLEQMRGMDEIFASIQVDNPDIAYLGISTPEGRVLRERRLGTVSGDDLRLIELPIHVDGRTVGAVIVGSDERYMQRQMNEILIDIATVLIIAGLIALELLIFLIAFLVTAPLQTTRAVVRRAVRCDLTVAVGTPGRDEVGRLGAAVNAAIAHLNTLHQRIGPAAISQRLRFAEPGTSRSLFSERLMYIRPPLFLLIFAESMSLSFFPLYVETVYQPIAWLPKEVVIGLPISIFMLIWALSLPFAGQWSDRAGRRRTFMIGACITSLGLILTGLANDMFQLLLWRSLTAVGYGIVFITAQGYVTDHTTPRNRTKGMALFLSGFFSGSLCGAAIGGILAERIGFEMTFYLSAVLSLAAALFVMRFLIERRDASAAQPPALTFGDFRSLLTDKYFATVTLLAAVPAKMALTGFLYYAGPLYLIHLGASQSAAGRVLMFYGLAIIIISPLAAWAADHLKRRQGFIIIGGVLSALALLSVYALDNLWGMLLGVAMLGTAHAIGVAPQLTLITELQKKSDTTAAPGKTIGIFRLTERIGNITGPLIAASLIAILGYQGAFAVMGLGALASVLLFTLLMTLYRHTDGNRLKEAQA